MVSGIKVPSASFGDFVPCLAEELIEEILCAPYRQGMPQKSGKALLQQCQDLIHLFMSTNMTTIIANPLCLSGLTLHSNTAPLTAASAVTTFVAWLSIGYDQAEHVKLAICRLYRMSKDAFDRAYRKLRRELVNLSSRIPGAMPGISIRNVLGRLAALKTYYNNVRSVRERSLVLTDFQSIHACIGYLGNWDA